MVNQSPVFFSRIKNFIEDQYKLVLVAGGCLVAAGVGLYSFKQHQNHMQERAQLAFSQTSIEVRHGEKKGELWPNAELAAKTGYRDYKNSSLAPYFLILESQALLAQGNNKQALEIIENALTEMGKDSPFYYMFKVKAALIKLDSDDITIQTSGFDQLQGLAYDTANKQRDEALYYLGNYYIVRGDTNRAQEVWKELINSFQGTADSGMSPWAMLALEKSKQS